MKRAVLIISFVLIMNIVLVIAPGSETSESSKIYLIKSDDYTSEEYDFLMKDISNWIKELGSYYLELKHNSGVTKESLDYKMGVFYYDKRALIVVGSHSSPELWALAIDLQKKMQENNVEVCTDIPNHDTLVDDDLRNSICGGAERQNQEQNKGEAILSFQPNVLFTSNKEVQMFFNNQLGFNVSIIQVKIKDINGEVIYGSGELGEVGNNEIKNIFKWDFETNVHGSEDYKVGPGKYLVEVKYAKGEEVNYLKKYLIIQTTRAVKCEDSDGKNFYEKGSVSDSASGYKYQDNCIDENGAVVSEAKKLIEYYCGENNYQFKYYECPNGCKDGKCVKIKPEEDPVKIPEDYKGEGVDEKVVCDGCIVEDKCAPVGYRMNGEYCDLTGEFLLQLSEEEACENNFECDSNVCVGGECVAKGLLKKILDWIKNIFS